MENKYYFPFYEKIRRDNGSYSGTFSFLVKKVDSFAAVSALSRLCADKNTFWCISERPYKGKKYDPAVYMWIDFG